MKWASTLESEVNLSTSEDRSGYRSSREAQPNCPTLLCSAHSPLSHSHTHARNAASVQRRHASNQLQSILGRPLRPFPPFAPPFRLLCFVGRHSQSTDVSNPHSPAVPLLSSPFHVTLSYLSFHTSTASIAPSVPLSLRRSRRRPSTFPNAFGSSSSIVRLRY